MRKCSTALSGPALALALALMAKHFWGFWRFPPREDSNQNDLAGKYTWASHRRRAHRPNELAHGVQCARYRTTDSLAACARYYFRMATEIRREMISFFLSISPDIIGHGERTQILPKRIHGDSRQLALSLYCRPLKFDGMRTAFDILMSV